VGLLSRWYGVWRRKTLFIHKVIHRLWTVLGVFRAFRHFFGGKYTIADYPQGKKMEPWLGMGAGLA
jgi:hypothetical protein